MPRRLLEALEASPAPSSLPLPLSWAGVESLARQLPAKTNLIVPKSALPARPPYSETRRGRSRGALRQFRCARHHQNLHVKEFDRHWVIHVDTWNPHGRLLRHLLVDHGFKRFLHLAELLEAGVRAPVPTPVAA